MYQLTESSMTRVWQHIEKTGKPIAFLSASRSENDEKTNNARTAKLKADVRAMGYGFFPLTGNYRYDDGTVSVEESVAVPEMVEADAVKLGKKYNQESVLFVSGKGDGAVLLYTDGSGKKEKLGELSPQKIAVAFSRLKNRGNDKNSTFTFESKRKFSSEKTSAFIEEYNSTLRHMVGGEPVSLKTEASKVETPEERRTAFIAKWKDKIDKIQFALGNGKSKGNLKMTDLKNRLDSAKYGIEQDIRSWFGSDDGKLTKEMEALVDRIIDIKKTYKLGGMM